ncbi:MAG: inositol monophosphatase family protein [Candidatus Bathyarchaeia archaeon]
MKRQIDWLDILIKCKNNIQEKIAPLIGKAERCQQNLGVGAGGDIIKYADIVAENAIIDTFKENGISSFTLISEESGIKEYGPKPSECFLTADPIDGTTNFTRGIPFFATSIALSNKPELTAIHTALVADLLHGTTYTAQKGKGAHRNNQKISPSKNMSLEEAVIGVDLNTYRVQEIAPRLNNIISRVKHIRHLGANALELCYVADGTTDAFIDIRGKLRSTDVAAAWLIINEAGAKITTPEGQALNIKLDPKQTVAFVAANKEIHKTILNLLKTSK